MATHDREVVQGPDKNRLAHWKQRVDLAAAFRWTYRLDLHEAVANHFSLAINEDGSGFLINPYQVHFANIRASDLLLIDANDPETMDRADSPDPTAWVCMVACIATAHMPMCNSSSLALCNGTCPA